MRCSPRLACITSLAVRRCPASLHTTPRAETGWGSSAATDADVGGCAGGLAAAGSGAVAGWCRFRKRASQRKRCCLVAERRAFPPALCRAAVASPFYLGRLLRRGDSAVGHPPSLLWACRRESTAGSHAARAGPKGVVQQGVGRGRSSGWATQRPCGWRVLLDARSHTSVHGLSLAVAHRRPSPLRAQTTSRWALRAARCSGAAC